MKQGDFAAAFGIPQTTYSGYEIGAREPKTDFWKAVADRYHVTIDYLMDFCDDPHQAKYGDRSRLDQRYGNLDDHGKRVVDLVLDAELERMAAPPVPVVDFHATVRHYLVPAAAGYAAPIEGEDYEDIPLPDGAPADADFCITVAGDSMEPYLPDGSLAYVKRGAPLQEFDPGVFFVGGGRGSGIDVFIKQWCVDSEGTLYLLSANPDREDKNIVIRADSSETVFCFGKVIGLKKKMPPPEYR